MAECAGCRAAGGSGRRIPASAGRIGSVCFFCRLRCVYNGNKVAGKRDEIMMRRPPTSPRTGLARPRAFARAVLACATVFATLTPLAAHALPAFDDVRTQWRSSDWLLLSRDGEPLQRTRVDLSERRGEWVALADVAPALREAIVVSEEKRFYEHAGVDWRGAAAAAWGNLWNTRTRGASTVTMQLSGLLDDEHQRW